MIVLAASGSAGTELIVGVLGAGGIGAIIAAIVSGYFSKKKLGAEATEIITKAAAGVVTNLQDENTRLQNQATLRNTEFEARLFARDEDHARLLADMRADHAREIAEYRRVLALHVDWDVRATAELEKIGVHLPPPPPLLP